MVEQPMQGAKTAPVQENGQRDKEPAVQVIALTQKGQIVEIIDTEECFEFNGLYYDGYNYGLKNNNSKQIR